MSEEGWSPAWLPTGFIRSLFTMFDATIQLRKYEALFVSLKLCTHFHNVNSTTNIWTLAQVPCHFYS